jgi:hypothetical protein
MVRLGEEVYSPHLVLTLTLSLRSGLEIAVYVRGLAWTVVTSYWHFIFWRSCSRHLIFGDPAPSTSSLEILLPAPHLWRSCSQHLIFGDPAPSTSPRVRDPAPGISSLEILFPAPRLGLEILLPASHLWRSCSRYLIFGDPAPGTSSLEILLPVPHFKDPAPGTLSLKYCSRHLNNIINMKCLWYTIVVSLLLNTSTGKIIELTKGARGGFGDGGIVEKVCTGIILT